MKQAVQVTILGQQYTVKSEASPEEVAKVAAFVNEKIVEVAAAGRTVDSLQAAVLALLNMAGAYLRLERAKSAAEASSATEIEAESRLRSLLEKLERVCPTAC